MSSISEKARGLDSTIAESLTVIGTRFSLPFDIVGKVIDYFQEMPTQKKIPTYRNDLPRLIEIAQTIWNAVCTYHQNILASSSKWSDEVKFGTEKAIKFLLSPLSFTASGDAVANLLGKEILGNVMKAVSFIFLQVFHLLPYIVLSTGFKIINMVYVRYPVALLTGIMGSMLFFQLYFLYRLGKEVEVTNKIMESAVALADKRTSFKKLQGRIKRWGPPILTLGSILYWVEHGLPNFIRIPINHLGELLQKV